ncbi:Mobile element protein [Candidatus Enterovibrio escicola]|uniref:Mobile element protein n=1 Tax=Candidatus Enterovibrio escicola TaxID=1927127 RepID=A0A2A5T189_9GAMM|nr:Mobile element protein [Candidatus Enterovibrio escacola]
MINDKGSIISVKVMTSNMDDRKPVPEMIAELWGYLYGDKGYISSSLERELVNEGGNTALFLKYLN